MDSNEKNQYEQLKQAVKDLLDKRSNTEMTHAEAYDFVFKSWGRDEFNRLIELVGWKKPETDPDNWSSLV